MKEARIRWTPDENRKVADALLKLGRKELTIADFRTAMESCVEKTRHRKLTGLTDVIVSLRLLQKTQPDIVLMRQSFRTPTQDPVTAASHPVTETPVTPAQADEMLVGVAVAEFFSFFRQQQTIFGEIRNELQLIKDRLTHLETAPKPAASPLPVVVSAPIHVPATTGQRVKSAMPHILIGGVLPKQKTAIENDFIIANLTRNGLRLTILTNDKRGGILNIPAGVKYAIFLNKIKHGWYHSATNQLGGKHVIMVEGITAIKKAVHRLCE